MSSSSSDVIGKKWSKQNFGTKVAADKTGYQVMYWNEDIFKLKASDRTDYSLQQCEMEIKLDKNAKEPTSTIDLTFGARFYANKDATTFKTTPEKDFEWFNEQMEYSAELEIVPVYENKQETQLEEKAFELDEASLDSGRVTAIAVYKTAKIDETEAAALLTEATTAATSAATKATEAATAATAAATAATEAATAATAAAGTDGETAANEAKTAADAAKTAADTAKTEADAAKTAADAFVTAATAYKTAADAGAADHFDTDKVTATSTTKAAALAAKPAEPVAPSAGGGRQVVRQSATNSFAQTFKNGFAIYENLTESDFWWWWLSLDIPNGYLANGELIYQFLTLVDKAGKDVPMSIGCWTTIGVADTYTIDQFTHKTVAAESTTNGALYSAASIDNPNYIFGKKLGEQAAALKEDAKDMDWKAGKSHVPASSLAPASSNSANTAYVCYFARELKKIGRNANSFNKEFTATIGARIYKDATVTTYSKIPESSSDISYPAPAGFVVAVDPTPTATPTDTGAFSLFSSTLAAVFVLLALNF